jgi:hypothetical protein
MNPDSFEQIPIARGVLGGRARFLRHEMSVSRTASAGYSDFGFGVFRRF